jgi:TonB-linked SusC/RagA family outer membrane protein
VYSEYENEFGGKHYVKALAGFNYEQSTFKGLSAQRNGLIYDDAQSISLALGTAINAAGPYEQWAVNGGFYRLNYGFSDRYLVEINGRYDGSSKFPTDKRYAFFPSGSVGWRVSNEPLWKISRKAISDLKLRASYGSLGNGSIGSYGFVEQFGVSQSGRVIGGIRPQLTDQPNVLPDNLTWEKATTLDFGVDVSFLSNRLDFNGDWYIRNTENMFTNGPTLPAVFGTSVPKGNYADLKTKGWEAVVSWRDRVKVLKSDLKYGIRFTLADYQAEITRYNNPTKLLSDYYVGQQLGEIWGYVNDGYFTASNLAEGSKQATIKSSNSGAVLPGDIKFADLNKDGTINTGANTVSNPGDRKIIGNATPRYTYGVLVDLEWKNFFFSAFLQGVGQQNWWPGAEMDAFWGPYNRPYNRVPSEMVDKIWSETNPEAYFPRLRGYIAQGTGRALNVTQTKYLQNVAYARLKNIQIGYNLPSSLIKKLKLTQAKFYISGENLFTFTPLYKVTHNFDVENIQGSDRVLTNGGNGNGNNYPMLKGYTIGVNLNF